MSATSLSWLRASAGQVLHLFVDDFSFATAIVAWLVVAGLAFPRCGLSGGWGGATLFGGLALILICSSFRRARR